MNILDEIHKIGIIPVVVIDDIDTVVPLAEALIAGGLPAAEITFRTDEAAEAIRIITEKFPKMIVGAGTVLTKEQVDEAVKAGAQFIVSPGFNPEVVEYSINNDIVILPGCSCPSDIKKAISMGLENVKFFPAEQLGGIKLLKAMSAPYNKMKFMPTGGLEIDNLSPYLELSNIIACGGSFMVKKEYIAKGDYESVVNETKKAVDLMIQFKFKEVMINDSKKEYIFESHNLERAVFHLERRGVLFNKDSFIMNNGKLESAVTADGGMRLIRIR